MSGERHPVATPLTAALIAPGIRRASSFASGRRRTCAACPEWDTGRATCALYGGRRCAFRAYLLRPGAVCLLLGRGTEPRWGPVDV